MNNVLQPSESANAELQTAATMAPPMSSINRRRCKRINGAA